MTQSVQIGESFVGEGVNAAHINTVLGHRDGPAGVAWATALATPSAGHVPFMAVLRPSLPVKPLTACSPCRVCWARHPHLGPGAGGCRRGSC